MGNSILGDIVSIPTNASKLQFIFLDEISVDDSKLSNEFNSCIYRKMNKSLFMKYFKYLQLLDEPLCDLHLFSIKNK